VIAVVLLIGAVITYFAIPKDLTVRVGGPIERT